MALNYINDEGGTDHFGGGAVPLKRRVVAVKSGQYAFADVTLQDNDGNAVDLTDYPPGETPATGSIKAKFKDSVTITSAADIVEATCTIQTAASGEIRCELPASVKNTPGIYVGEFAVLDDDDRMLFSNTLWVVVDQGLFGTINDSVGPPSLAEIRLFLRDFSQENELLDTVDFDMSEIAAAITLPVRFWNEILPPLRKTYNTQNFPWRYHWLIAICANLFSIAAEHYRRNRLAYSAGGMQVDDKNKANDYEQKAAQMKQEWERFARSKKVSLNLNAGYGEYDSMYS
tara:strand:- start:335 stop:1195 length:861 start_codon:yes stop_codon:yes gene_type:complete